MNFILLLLGLCIFMNLSFGIEATSVLNNDYHSIPKNLSSYAPSPYDLEQFCNEEDEYASINIQPWKAAIFKIGFILDGDGSLASKRIHRCKVKISTDKNFWLAVSIEHMKIRGIQDKSNKWICSDYLKFASSGQNIIKKFFKILDLDIFNDGSSELCGTKQLDSSVLQYTKILGGQSTDMNSFFTASNSLAMTFHQEKDSQRSFNNSFIVIVTTFRHASDVVECKDKQKCHGSGDIFCIDPSFVCDGHINCAFPGSGTDERICKANEKASSVFNWTTWVIIVIVSLVSVGLVICIVSTVACRMKRRLMVSSRRSSSPSSIHMAMADPSAPRMRIERESTLPLYETVILSDAEPGIVKNDPKKEELPPQYDSLFPQGPPPTSIVKSEEVNDS